MTFAKLKGIRPAPEAPIIKCGFLLEVLIVGIIVLIHLFPGSTLLGIFISSAKLFIWLFKYMLSTNNPEPKKLLNGFVVATAIPSQSMTEKCVVLFSSIIAFLGRKYCLRFM